MTTKDCGLGFRIVGGKCNERRLVDWRAAFLAYCAGDDRIDTTEEAYLSAWMFPAEFQELQDPNLALRTKGYSGPCGGDWLWIDIDRAGQPGEALRDARTLIRAVVDRYQANIEEVLVFFSGDKGFHIGLPSIWFNPEPSCDFTNIVKSVCLTLGDSCGVVIDASIYDRVRAFRAPNSRHPKTGLHKVMISPDELQQLTIEGIQKKAKHPNLIDLTENVSFVIPRAIDDWQAASKEVQEAQLSRDESRTSNPSGKLNRATLLFIREGAGSGERAKMLFSAAANLTEIGCPLHAVTELLTEAGRDSGLSPSEVKRQIQCGFDHARRPQQ